MNSREIDREVRRLAAERGWDDWTGDKRSEVILLLLNAREDARRHILGHAASLRRDLDHLEQVVQRPSPILNTLGELQSRPSAVEAAVGEFAAAEKALQTYLKAFPPVVA